MRWAAETPRIGGVLAPDVEGFRTILTLADGKIHPFELTEEAAGAGGEEVVRIGRFCFSASTLKLVRKTLLEDCRGAFDWLVIDEIGKLEMEGMGYEPAAGEVVALYNKGETRGRLLLVVRSQLLEPVIAKYGLKNCTVIHSTKELS